MERWGDSGVGLDAGEGGVTCTDEGLEGVGREGIGLWVGGEIRELTGV